MLDVFQVLRQYQPISKLVFVCVHMCVYRAGEERQPLKLCFEKCQNTELATHLFGERSVCLDETYLFCKYKSQRSLTSLALLLNFCSH